MKSIWTLIGIILWIGGGIAMFVFYLLAMIHWLGLLGAFLAFITSPGIIVFPLIYWAIEGVFPVLYFFVWGIGILGMIIVGVSSGTQIE